MIKAVRLYLLFALVGVTICSVSAQTKDKLGDQLSAVEKELEKLDNQISSNVNQQKSQLQISRELDAKISTREKFIAEIDGKVMLLKNDMGSDGRALAANQAQLNTFRDALADLLRSSYKKSYSGATFSPTSIHESQKVISLHRQVAFLTAKIKHKIAENDSLAQVLGSRLQEVKTAYASVVKLQTERAGELVKLQREKAQAAALHKRLKQQEGSLRTQADIKKAQMVQLQRQISDAIAKEAGKKVSDVDRSIFAKQSKVFGENKGRLPLPVSPASVVDRYGVHEHPTQKGLKINNNGVNLRSAVGSMVRCVGDGEVRAVMSVDGLGSSIIVRHGNFLTVYANMKDLRVRGGDKISAGFVLGILQDDELHFEIWEETKNLNPELWLGKFNK